VEHGNELSQGRAVGAALAQQLVRLKRSRDRNKSIQKKKEIINKDKVKKR
jgi:hypothetical protein